MCHCVSHVLTYPLAKLLGKGDLDNELWFYSQNLDMWILKMIPSPFPNGIIVAHLSPHHCKTYMPPSKRIPHKWLRKSSLTDTYADSKRLVRSENNVLIHGR